MAVYASTMILRGLRLTGEKRRGDTLTTAEQTECLAELNTMLDGWSIQPLMSYQLLQYSFALTTSTASYTIGPGATLSTTVRPVNIVDPCFVRDSSNLDVPLTIISPQSYGAIGLKSTGTTYPNYLTYDKGLDSNAYGTITIYPTPSANLTLFINTQQVVATFSTLTHGINLPPGYQLAIETNYAVQSDGGYGNLSPTVAKLARDSLAAIKSQNLPEVISSLESGVLPMYGGSRRSVLTGP